MILEVLFIAVALSMDAFAVSICKGLSFFKINIKKIITISLYFGVFQAIMPILGYMLGSSFQTLFDNIDHWIIFILLFIIGLNMILESFKEKENKNDNTNFKEMIALSLATSIDAFAVGVTFAFLDINIIIAAFIIGLTTFILSSFAVFIGYKINTISSRKAEIVGGLILILIAFKILLEHLFN